MKRISSLVIILMVMIATSQGLHAASKMRFEILEEAIETDSYGLRLSGNGKGHMSGKNCDTCPEWRVNIVRESVLIKAGVEVPISKLLLERNKSLVILYEPETRNVTRIIWQ